MEGRKMGRTTSRRASSGVLPAASAGNKGAAEEQDRIDAIFFKYADKNEEFSIGPEGVEALCQDLKVSPTDIRILLLAWKLQASRQGYFSLEEWRKGFMSMRVDSLKKLKQILPTLLPEVGNHQSFKDFYTFAFQYCLTEPRQKTLDLETARQMLELVLEPHPHLSRFVQFLEEQSEYKGMNLDQWTAFLRFYNEISPDLANYDGNQAWPLLLDNFVEWALTGSRST